MHAFHQVVVGWSQHPAILLVINKVLNSDAVNVQILLALTVRVEQRVAVESSHVNRGELLVLRKETKLAAVDGVGQVLGHVRLDLDLLLLVLVLEL